LRFELVAEPLASGAMLVTLQGELDLACAYTFDRELRRLEDSAPDCIVIDMRGLTFVDSSGLGRLLGARRRARRAGRRLVLVRGGHAIQRLLAIAGLEESFETVGEVPEELRAPAPARPPG
jgi:anti-sigma B factor antagonist